MDHHHQASTGGASSLLEDLVQKTTAATPAGGSFRTRAVRVGAVYTMTYRRATVAVYDFDREKAGGLPKGGFLMAAKPEGNESFVLLRILQEARLPNSVPNDLTRQQGVESTSNDKPWPEALDPWMKDRVGCGSSSLTAQSVSPAAARQEAIGSVKAW